MTIGTAYGFFNCRAASPQVIEAALPEARDVSGTPSALELSVIDDVENLQGDSVLMGIARDEAKPAGYVMEARLAGATNEQTAMTLNTLLNQLYQSPLIHQPGDTPGRLILYQDEATGDYLSRA